MPLSKHPLSTLSAAIVLAVAGTGTAHAGQSQTPTPQQPLPVHASAAQSAQAQAEAAMALPAELRAMLGTLDLGQGVASLDKVRRLYEFMVGEEGLGLRYLEQPTHSIAGSFASREVNCLSFTMMFIALARASGLNAYAQSSEDALAMRVLDDTLYRARHVKAGVDIDGLQYTVDVGWRSVVAEARPRRISDVELVALLHNNNAVERLLAGDLPGATTETGVMLALDSRSATIWSNAGVVHWRSGRRDAAEYAYTRALEFDPDHLGALGNMVVLYESSGDSERAREYGKRLQRAQASDPFSQFILAERLANQGQYGDALSHYKRAARLLPNEPTFHRGMAEAYQGLGKESAARRSFKRAESLELRKFSQRGIRDTDPSS